MSTAEPSSTRSSGFAKSSAASRGYEFTSFWEKTAALDGSQLSAIALLGESIAASKHRDFSGESSQRDSVVQSGTGGEEGRAQEEQGVTSGWERSGHRHSI